MLLRKIRIILIVLFVIAAVAAAALAAWHYTHDDISAPVFTSDYDLLVASAKATDEQLCAGLHAYDNIDGDITDRIMVKSVSPLINTTDAVITYLVFDNASNATTYSRTIRYTDYHVPRFTISQPLSYAVGDKITLLDRLTATDVIDGDISSRIMLTQAAVANSVAGAYPITVQVTNSAGDTAILPLTVTVHTQSASAPILRLSTYLVYISAGTDVDWRSYISAVRDPLVGDGVLSTVVCNSEEVDPDTPGVYEVYYYYIGQSGETTTVILTVVVE